MSKAELKIEGMSCMHCVMAVKKALMETKGVKDAQVEMGKAVVTYDEGQVKPEALAEAVTKAGYKVAKS
jgi:copper chaperone